MANARSRCVIDDSRLGHFSGDIKPTCGPFATGANYFGIQNTRALKSCGDLLLRDVRVITIVTQVTEHDLMQTGMRNVMNQLCGLVIG